MEIHTTPPSCLHCALLKLSAFVVDFHSLIQSCKDLPLYCGLSSSMLASLVKGGMALTSKLVVITAVQIIGPSIGKLRVALVITS